MEYLRRKWTHHTTYKQLKTLWAQYQHSGNQAELLAFLRMFRSGYKQLGLGPQDALDNLCRDPGPKDPLPLSFILTTRYSLWHSIDPLWTDSGELFAPLLTALATMSPDQASDCEAMEHVLSVLLIISRNRPECPHFNLEHIRALLRPSSQPWPSSVHRLMLQLLSSLATTPGICEAIAELQGFDVIMKMALQEASDGVFSSLVVGLLWRMIVDDLDSSPSIGSLGSLAMGDDNLGTDHHLSAPPEAHTSHFPPGHSLLAHYPVLTIHSLFAADAKFMSSSNRSTYSEPIVSVRQNILAEQGCIDGLIAIINTSNEDSTFPSESLCTIGAILSQNTTAQQVMKESGGWKSLCLWLSRCTTEQLQLALDSLCVIAYDQSPEQHCRYIEPLRVIFESARSNPEVMIRVLWKLATVNIRNVAAFERAGGFKVLQGLFLSIQESEEMNEAALEARQLLSYSGVVLLNSGQAPLRLAVEELQAIGNSPESLNTLRKLWGQVAEWVADARARKILISGCSLTKAIELLDRYAEGAGLNLLNRCEAQSAISAPHDTLISLSLIVTVSIALSSDEHLVEFIGVARGLERLKNLVMDSPRELSLIALELLSQIILVGECKQAKAAFTTMINIAHSGSRSSHRALCSLRGVLSLAQSHNHPRGASGRSLLKQLQFVHGALREAASMERLIRVALLPPESTNEHLDVSAASEALLLIGAAARGSRETKAILLQIVDGGVLEQLVSASSCYHVSPHHLGVLFELATHGGFLSACGTEAHIADQGAGAESSEESQLDIAVRVALRQCIKPRVLFSGALESPTDPQLISNDSECEVAGLHLGETLPTSSSCSSDCETNTSFDYSQMQSDDHKGGESTDGGWVSQPTSGTEQETGLHEARDSSSQYWRWKNVRFRGSGFARTIFEMVAGADIEIRRVAMQHLVSILCNSPSNQRMLSQGSGLIGAYPRPNPAAAVSKPELGPRCASQSVQEGHGAPGDMLRVGYFHG